MAKKPNRVVAALTTAPTTVGGIVLRDLTAGTYLVLQKLNHPLITAKPGEMVTLSDLDTSRLLFILSHPAAQTYSLLESGVSEFDESVVEFVDQIPLDDMPAMKDALGRKIGLAQSAAPSAGDGEKKTATRTSPKG